MSPLHYHSLPIVFIISGYCRVKWIDRSKGKVGAKVTLVDGHKGEGHALRSIQQHYRTTIDDMPVSERGRGKVQQMFSPLYGK